MSTVKKGLAHRFAAGIAVLVATGALGTAGLAHADTSRMPGSAAMPGSAVNAVAGTSDDRIDTSADPTGPADPISFAGMSADQMTASNGWHTVYYSGQTQQRWNWCGPAATATVLTNWRISGVPQSTLANKELTTWHVLGFTFQFTGPGRLATTLNDYIKRHAYHVHAKTTNEQLWNLVVNDVKQGHPAVILVQSNKIPWGGGRPGEGHYFVIVGYNTNYNGKAAYSIWDPAAGAIHSLAKNDWQKFAWGTSFGGLYRFAIA